MRDRLRSIAVFVKHHKALTAYFTAWLIYFGVFYSRLYYFDERGDLFAGLTTVWGDWCAHFTMGSSMAYRSIFLKTSPLLFGAPFSYPIFSSPLSAVLIRLGLPFFFSFIFPSFVFSVLAVFCLYWFYKVVFQSSKTAMVASLIFLFNGGLGFLRFLDDVLNSASPLKAFFLPSQSLTNAPKAHLYWHSIIETMLIPQRALQHGLPLGLISLTLVFTALHKMDAFGRKETGASLDGRSLPWRRLVVAGLLWGCMPIIHTHSFIALSVIFAGWFLGDLMTFDKDVFRYRFLCWFLVGSVSIFVALPLIKIFIMGGVNTSEFIRWFPGWYAKEDKLSWIGFWVKNWGITPFLAILGFVAYYITLDSVEKKIRAMFYAGSFLAVFVLVNLVVLQPWLWDNTKVLMWASLGISGFAGHFICRLDRGEV